MINLHNHSTWSDGRYTPEQLVEQGVRGGLTHIGISDHFYTAKLSLPMFYVDAGQIDAYAADLRRVAGLYTGQIQVLVGLEVDWSLRAGPRLAALWPQLDHLDYVLFEYVQDADWYGDSLESLLTVLPHVPVPAGLAHNHLSHNFADCAVEQLVETLDRHHIFVELCTKPEMAYYRRSDPYTNRLWELLAQSNVRFSIGSDTHRSLDDVAGVQDAYHFLQERGLQERLITCRWDADTRGWSPCQSGHT